MAYEVTRTEEEWRRILDPEAFRVLRQAGTERPFTNEHWRTAERGTYLCGACLVPLFQDEAKFFSSCGWPAFYTAAQKGLVEEKTDFSFGMRRVEVLCARCGSHLGHVFEDAPETPTGLRYCINSISLRFVPEGEEVPAPLE